MTQPRILIVDDEPDIRHMIGETLSDEGYRVTAVHDANAARTATRLDPYDAIILDIWMPGDDGITLLKEWRDKEFKTPVVMLSAHGSVETAMEATRYGAFDYLEKPISTGRLLVSIRNALGITATPAEEVGRKEVPGAVLVGSSSVIQELRRQVKRIAGVTGRVLITGEYGSGKKLIAHLVHSQEGKASETMVTVDLLNSTRMELNAENLIDSAKGGTLLFPDIHMYDGSKQSRMLGLLNQIHGYEGTDAAVDMPRLIATTDVSISDMMDSAQFRPELYFALNHLEIHVPALRDHPEDIRELVGHFTDIFSVSDRVPYKRIETATLNRFRNHTWPGNILELQNVLRQTLLTGTGDRINSEDVEQLLKEIVVPSPLKMDHRTLGGSAGDYFERPIREAREQFEREYLLFNLKQSESFTEMSQKTGIHRSTLFRKLKEHGIKVEPGSEQEEK